jgi:hypothetical protein
MHNKKKPIEVVFDHKTFAYEPGQDMIPALQRALDSCRNIKATRLVFPEADYFFSEEKALEVYIAVSNNDNGLKRVAFLLDGFSDFEIDAQGSNFIFHGMIVPFEIRNCKNISLKGFSINWDRPFYGQANVVAVNKTTKTFDVSIDDEFEYEIHGGQLWYKTTRGYHDIQKNIWFDPKTTATVYDVNKYKIDPWNQWISDKYSAKEISKGLVRIKTPFSEIPEVGWVWAALGGDGSRLIPAIHLFRTDKLVAENITLLHSGGMGLIAENSSDIHLENFNVHLPENSKRMVSTAVDATHFVNCRGLISFNNCLFENMLDDATNVHGTYLKITDIIGKNKVGAKLMHNQQYGFRFAWPGDTVRFTDNKTLMPAGLAVVKNVEVKNQEYTELEFDRDISEFSKLGFGLENLSWTASVKMTNCIVRQNRARSILISTPKKVLIENNEFASMMSGLLVAGDVNYWFESGPVNDFTLLNNKFINCCTDGRGSTVIYIGPELPNKANNSGYYHKNITIEGNIIEAFDHGIIYAQSVENLIIRNNSIEQTFDFDPIFPEKPTIDLKLCRNVLIENNQYINSRNNQAANILMDEHTRKSIKIIGNKGFEEKYFINNN